LSEYVATFKKGNSVIIEKFQWR